MRLRHPRRLLAGTGLTVVVLLLALAGYAGWLVWQANTSLSAAATDATRLKAAVEEGDQQRIGRALDDLRTHSTDAHEHTSGTAWSAMTHVPFVGDDAEGVQVVTEVLTDLSSTGGLQDLGRAAQDLDRLLPRGGKVDLTMVEEMRRPVSAGADALTRADETLATQDAAGYLELLKTNYRDLQTQISDAADAMTSADHALQVLPEMLGGDGPRRYLMVFQNNAEIRTSGGLPGAVTLVEAKNGELELRRQVPGNSFGETEAPVLPLSDGEQALYYDQLGRWFLNANLTPDFPRSAELWKAFWTERFGGQIDGVLTLDPVTVSYLLEATGPITVDGVRINSQNAVDQLLHDAYVDRRDPRAQDRFFQEVAAELFAKVTEDPGQPQNVIRALARGTSEGRVLVHSFDDKTQGELAGTEIAGELSTDATDRPQVGVYLNDSTGSKMSYYLRYDVDASATYCNAGTQGLSAQATLSSQAPKDAGRELPRYITGGGLYGTKPGDQLVTVFLYGPTDGSIAEVAIDGEKVPFVETAEHDGRPVAKTYVQLAPKQTTDVTWTMKTGPDQTGDPQLQVTPSIVPGNSSAPVRSACR